MAKTKAQELNVKGLSNGPACQCAYCNPRKDRVGADKVWAWALTHPNESVWR